MNLKIKFITYLLILFCTQNVVFGMDVPLDEDPLGVLRSLGLDDNDTTPKEDPKPVVVLRQSQRTDPRRRRLEDSRAAVAATPLGTFPSTRTTPKKIETLLGYSTAAKKSLAPSAPVATASHTPRLTKTASKKPGRSPYLDAAKKQSAGRATTARRESPAERVLLSKPLAPTLKPEAPVSHPHTSATEASLRKRRNQTERDKARAIREKEAALLATMPRVERPERVSTTTKFAQAFNAGDADNEPSAPRTDDVDAKAPNPNSTTTDSPFPLLDQRPGKLRDWLTAHPGTVHLNEEGKTLCTQAVQRRLTKHVEVILTHDLMLALQKNSDSSCALDLLCSTENHALMTAFNDAAITNLSSKDYESMLNRKIKGSSATVRQTFLAYGIIHGSTETAAVTAATSQKKQSKQLRMAIATFKHKPQSFMDFFNRAMKDENQAFFDTPIANDLVSKFSNFKVSYESDSDSDDSDDNSDEKCSSFYYLHADEPYFIALIMAISEKNFWAIDLLTNKVKDLCIELENDDKSDNYFNIFHLIFRGNILNGAWTQEELLRLIQIICTRIESLRGDRAARVITHMLSLEDEKGETPREILAKLGECRFYIDRDAAQVLEYLDSRYPCESSDEDAPSPATTVEYTPDSEDDTAPPVVSRDSALKALERLDELEKKMKALELEAAELKAGKTETHSFTDELYAAAQKDDVGFFKAHDSSIRALTKWSFSLFDPISGIILRKKIESSIPYFVPLILIIHTRSFLLIQHILNQVGNFSDFVSPDTHRNIFHLLLRGKMFVQTLWNEDELIQLIQIMCNHPTFEPTMLTTPDIEGKSPMDLLAELNETTPWYSSENAENIITYLEYQYLE